jgi:hypothetical protein
MEDMQGAEKLSFFKENREKQEKRAKTPKKNRRDTVQSGKEKGGSKAHPSSPRIPHKADRNLTTCNSKDIYFVRMFDLNDL